MAIMSSISNSTSSIASVTLNNDFDGPGDGNEEVENYTVRLTVII